MILRFEFLGDQDRNRSESKKSSHLNLVIR
jgi:hypothetical protein